MRSRLFGQQVATIGAGCGGETEGSSVSQAKDQGEESDIGRLLAGAAKTIGVARYCWLATAAKGGGVNHRPMGRLLPDLGEDEWTLRFLTDGRSRKAEEMRREGAITMIFQHDPDDAFVTLIGHATLSGGEAEVRARWKSAYDVYFPSQADRANAAFVKVDVARMELWIRGVTPEPFGLRPTILERDVGGGWRLFPV
jgi:general stress protein 26